MAVMDEDDHRSSTTTHYHKNPLDSMVATAFLVLLLFTGTGASFPDFWEDSSPQPSTPAPRSSFSSSWDDFRSLLDAHRGQKRCDKLPMLKRYLQQFGYQTWPEFTTDFDNRTEEAIKLYQSNFRLNATGILDAATIGQMIKPRCGAADVVDGISAMARNSNSSSSRFLHRGRDGVRDGVRARGVRHYSFFPNSPKWESKTLLTYAIDSSAPALTGIAMADLRALFADAFGSWAAVVPLNFTEIDRFELADIRILFAHGEHGDGRPFDGTLGVLAHGFSPEDGKLHFDAAETWTLDVARSASRSAVDLRSVAVHEIGHILGLGHSAVEDAVMFPNIGAREVKLDLNSDDVDGAQALYGANPNYDPSTRRSETRSQPENGIPSSAAPPRSSRLAAAIAMIVIALATILA